MTASISSVASLLVVVVEARPNALAYSGPAWSPYLVGALIGLLGLATLLFSQKTLGASTAFARIAGLVGMVIAPRHTASLKYFQENKPMIDWEVMVVVGAVVGAMLAAWQGNELQAHWLPAMWAAKYGSDSLPLHLVSALIGGIIMAFGARLAGGCTSGHGISGTMQLSVSSWIAVICFFIGGIATAMLLYAN